MDCHLIPVYPPMHSKKRKLSDEMNDNDHTPAMEDTIACGRQFLHIPHSDKVYQTEEWCTADSALFHPVTDDLMVNVRSVEQISCADGHYFVADHSGKYSRTVTGKVIHFWRYDKTQRKLYVSRSFLFTGVQVSAARNMRL
ncbi:hypothetical protein V1264_022939 [Littorina saxatilis]|uniref:Uncharacterized protein n=1 Tax=Littorina saxatilis TaxID=31220 RepID=A0AAN9G8V6_9CAEN